MLFPDPGFKKEYVKRTYKHNEPLIKGYQISEENNIVKAYAGDAIEGWKNLSKSDIENINKNNVYYLCCGTKPHSLSLALRCLILHNPTLLYIRPDKHRVVNIHPTDVYWTYEVKDMSSIKTSDNV